MAAFAGSPVLASAALLSDTFDGAALGSTPSGWSLARPVAGTSANVVAGTPAGNQWVDFHDDNAPGTVTNNTLSRTFPAVVAGSSAGRVLAQCDVLFQQVTAGFGLRLTNGNVATSGGNWAAGVIFEGNIAFAPGASPGGLSYQTLITAYAWSGPAWHYQANVWYTLRIDANLETQTYQVFFGPRAGALAEITPAGGVPFITGTTTAAVTQAGGIAFLSSVKDGDSPGDMLIDNVSVTQEPDNAVPVSSIAEARLLERNTKVSLSNKIVTAGTAHGVFCIQDDTRTAGIRVRSGGPAVQQGDRVNVVGRIVQLSAGVPSQHTGEREIVANQVTITSAANSLPCPLVMCSADLGGGWLGPNESLADGPEPVVKGVWPYNAWGNGGVTSFNTTANSLSPLNNTGLIVSVTGMVTEPTVYDTPGTDWDFYIDDGSLASDGWFDTASYTDEVFHPRGLRVRVTDPSLLPAVPLHYGDWVTVTGVSGAIGASELGRASLHNVRVIRPRTASDIQVAQKQTVHTAFDSSGTALVNGKPYFPIGVYLYSFSSDVLNNVLSQGFNTVIYGVTPSDLPTLNANNLMTIPYTTSDWMAQKDNPAILAWYLADEPEGHGQTPAYMRQQYEQVRASDPSHPMGMAHFLWDALTDYKESEDFVMSDVYPLLAGGPYPLNPISGHIDEIHALHGYNYPVWPAIQAFGGPTTENGKWALPTPDQERSMTYLALAHGAKGILFFSCQPGHVDLWAEVKVLVGELKQFTPFFVLPSSNLNISSSDDQVQVRCIQVGGSGLIIADNINPAGRTATISIPQLPVSSLTLPLDGGSISAPSGQFSATFQPYQVIVYQWGTTPSL